MLGLTWLAGLVRRRLGRLAAVAVGIALAVGLLASIGSFISHSKATMTKRSAATVAVDWQVELQPGGDSSAVAQTIAHQPGVRAALPVGFAETSGLSATAGGTTQTTGAGVVLGVPDGYRAVFPDAIRDLVGGPAGVLVAQQTAANLHVAPGDTIMIGRAGLKPASVRVAGVVDLPQAQSLFQTVGAPANAQPTASPDNVVLLPIEQWHRVFDPLNVTRADLVRTQFHVRLDHRLPADPSAAYASVLGRANNLEVKLAGTGLVGDNLAATLGAARGDALYAEVLFLFLGLPGAVLAGLLTATVANAGADRRRREQALLRTRGATTRQLVQIALSETLFVGVLGAIAGLGLASAIGAAAFHHASFGATSGSAIGWGAGSALAGFVIAAGSIAWPAGRDAHAITVATARRTIGRARTPRWIRLGLDGWLLGAGLLVFWLTGRGGYQIVLAPEGVPSISVSYWAFAGPALLWIGAGLFAWRISELFLRRGTKALIFATRPVSGSLASTVAATMSRQRRLLARGVAVLALTAAFAASTAVFNATYRQQANVDALLTNGADVTVTIPPGAPVNANYERRLAAVPGVRHVEAMQHRFAYVGADLQDLYGIKPATIAKATKLQDAFFKGGTVKQLMTKLAQRPDNVLVSAETVKDFQLVPGDSIRLRLRDEGTNQLVTVPFHYAGIGNEFPTAPKDSFLVANRDYITAQTGSGATGAFLLDTGGVSPAKVAARVKTIVGTTATVTDIAATRQLVGSSLTAVDLAGLTRVELGFALALAAAAGGLALWLGFAERRRTFAIAAALGAKRRQLGGFVWSEAAFVGIGGALLGALGGWALSEMLVKVLTGVFDPPPASLAVPWAYLGIAAVVTIAAVVVAAVTAISSANRPAIESLRDL